jgi:hypothetical protein
MHKNGGGFLEWRPRAARKFLEMAAGDSEETLDFMKMALFFSKYFAQIKILRGVIFLISLSTSDTRTI